MSDAEPRRRHRGPASTRKSGPGPGRSAAPRPGSGAAQGAAALGTGAIRTWSRPSPCRTGGAGSSTKRSSGGSAAGGVHQAPRGRNPRRAVGERHSRGRRCRDMPPVFRQVWRRCTRIARICPRPGRIFQFVPELVSRAPSWPETTRLNGRTRRPEGARPALYRACTEAWRGLARPNSAPAAPPCNARACSGSACGDPAGAGRGRGDAGGRNAHPARGGFGAQRRLPCRRPAGRPAKRDAARVRANQIVMAPAGPRPHPGSAMRAARRFRMLPARGAARRKPPRHAAEGGRGAGGRHGN